MRAYIDVSTAEIPTPEEAEDLFARLDKHVGGGELSQELRMEIIGRWGDRRVLEGTLVWTPTTTLAVDLDREVDGRRSPQVRLQYCVDATELAPVGADTGPVDQPTGRRLWTVLVVWSNDWFGQSIAGWRVRERLQLEDPC